MGRKAANEIAANDRSLNKARRTRVAKQTEYSIAGEKGLSLVVKPSGAASYSMRYTIGEVGQKKDRRAILGSFEDMTLAEAKDEADEIRREVRKGVDKHAGPPDLSTLRQLFETFEEHDTRRTARTLRDYRGHLERDVFDALGDKPIADLTAKDVARVLTKIDTRSASAAHNCRSALGTLYKWAKSRHLVEENIMIGMGFIKKPTARQNNINDDVLRAIWTSLDRKDCGVSTPIKMIIRLAILTGQRNSEVAGAEKCELDLKATDPVWVIPGRRMKRKTEDQIVFLSTQAAELFKQAISLTSNKEPLVFPKASENRPQGERSTPHLSQASVSKAMIKARDLAGVEDVTLHDFRKAITTWLGDRVESPDVLDRILHHGSQNVTRTHYNFATMEKWLRPAWQQWGDHVEAVVKASKVKTTKAID